MSLESKKVRARYCRECGGEFFTQKRIEQHIKALHPNRHPSEWTFDGTHLEDDSHLDRVDLKIQGRTDSDYCKVRRGAHFYTPVHGILVCACGREDPYQKPERYYGRQGIVVPDAGYSD